MATNIYFTANSPHTLVLNINGGGGAAPKTRAEVLAACQNGPLKEFLSRTPDWTVFNLGGALCGRVHTREIVNRATGACVISFEFFWEAAPGGIKADATGTCQVEIRLQQSERR